MRDERTLYIYACECLNNLLKEEGEKIIAAFFDIARYSPYKYQIYHKMYNFYMHFDDPQRAVDALTKAIAEDPKCAEAYYKLGRHALDKKDDPLGAMPLLRTAAAIALPAYGEPEIEAYTHGPWEALCRSYFRLEDYQSARQMAQKALQHNSPNSGWLAQLVDYETNVRPAQRLPSNWQEWLEGNALHHAIPNHVLMRILEGNGFTPGQIISGVTTGNAKKSNPRCRPPRRSHASWRARQNATVEFGVSAVWTVSPSASMFPPSIAMGQRWTLANTDPFSAL